MSEDELLLQSIGTAMSGVWLGTGTIGAVIGLGAAVLVLVALLAGNPRAMSLGLSLWLVGSVMSLGLLVVGLWPFSVIAAMAAPAALLLGVAVRLMLVRRRPAAGFVATTAAS